MSYTYFADARAEREAAVALVRARVAEAALGQEVDQELLDAVCTLVPGVDGKPSAEYLAHLRARLELARVPAQLHDGLVAYVASRRRVGSFLTAVLSNDLQGAIARADEDCQAQISRIVCFLVWYAPATCWGSPLIVDAWLTDPRPAPEVFE